MATRVYSNVITLTIEALPDDLTVAFLNIPNPLTSDPTIGVQFNQEVSGFETIDVNFRRVSPVELFVPSTANTTITVDPDDPTLYSMAIDLSDLISTEIDADFRLRFLMDRVMFQGTQTGPAANVDSDVFRVNTYVSARWTDTISVTVNENTTGNRIADLFAISSGTDRTFSVGTLPSEIRSASIENDDELVFDVGDVDSNTNVFIPIIVENPGGENTLMATITIVDIGGEVLYTRADDATALYTQNSGTPLYTR